MRNTESSLTTVINRLSDNEHKGMFATLEKGIGRTIRFDPNIVDGIGGAKDTLVNLKDILEEVKMERRCCARAIQPEEMFTLWQTTGGRRKSAAVSCRSPRAPSRRGPAWKSRR